MADVIAGQVFAVFLELQRTARTPAQKLAGSSRNRQARQPQLKSRRRLLHFGIIEHQFLLSQESRRPVRI
jgi:hypothetical protein